MNNKLSKLDPTKIFSAPEGTTYKIDNKEFPVTGYVKLNDNFVPLVDIPSMSDYKWQLMCLQDRLEHPEKYQNREDVEATIERLKKWLEEHAKKEGNNENA